MSKQGEPRGVAGGQGTTGRTHFDLSLTAGLSC